MDRTEWRFIVIGAVFLLPIVPFVGNLSTAGAAELCSIVTIRGREDIEPERLVINKGNCVVWINLNGGSTQMLPNQQVLLTFKDGAKCIKATKSPILFKMDVPSGCFIAGYMGYGQTASLIFMEPGTYKYDIEFKAGGKNTATIEVK